MGPFIQQWADAGQALRTTLGRLFVGVAATSIPILVFVSARRVFYIMTAFNNKYVHWGLLQDLGRVSSVTG
jgi:hypothetical protein